MQLNQLNTLPDGLPVPVDDGSAAHLEGMELPNLNLTATDGSVVNLKSTLGRLVLYMYPLTGRPDVPLPDGWDAISGARGCTPQACDFSNHHQALTQLGAAVFGLSSQASDDQLELKNRLHLPFELLSDSDFKLKQRMNFLVFKVNELMLYKRLTLIADNSVIKKVFYPVFPPNQNASQVLDWLRSH